MNHRFGHLDLFSYLSCHLCAGLFFLGLCRRGCLTPPLLIAEGPSGRQLQRQHVAAAGPTSVQDSNVTGREGASGPPQIKNPSLFQIWAGYQRLRGFLILGGCFSGRKIKLRYKKCRCRYFHPHFTQILTFLNKKPAGHHFQIKDIKTTA